jgi:uncharacterized ferredoxin-like protein
MKSARKLVSDRVDVGPVSQVGPVDLSEVSSKEELDEKVQEMAEEHDVDVENIDREKAKNVGREILSYWKQSAQTGFMASMTGDYSLFAETVKGRQAGILGNFKGIGTVITGIAISLGVGAIVLGKFQEQTNNSEANTILGDGLGLLQDTIGFMEIGVVMLFGVIFMRYME